MPLPSSTGFGAKSTADDIVSGLDLAGQTILITGCNSGIGFETMRALASHGAHIIALARSESAAREAAARTDGHVTPIACDLSDITSVDEAIQKVRALDVKLDAIIANAGMMGAPKVETLYGVEKQFWINHIAHFGLVTGLLDQVRDQTGRIVVVSSVTSIQGAPREGILFDNLDGARTYKSLRFYAHSKLANALFARELSGRLQDRAIAVNSLHPGMIMETAFLRNFSPLLRLLTHLGRRLGKTIPQGAATQTLLAAHPSVAGMTGLYWSDCNPAKGSLYLDDPAMAERLWTVTEEILARARCS